MLARLLVHLEILCVCVFVFLMCLRRSTARNCNDVRPRDSLLYKRSNPIVQSNPIERSKAVEKHCSIGLDRLSYAFQLGLTEHTASKMNTKTPTDKHLYLNVFELNSLGLGTPSCTRNKKRRKESVPHCQLPEPQHSHTVQHVLLLLLVFVFCSSWVSRYVYTHLRSPPPRVLGAAAHPHGRD